MQKKILALALCALIPVVSIAVANAEDYDDVADYVIEESEQRSVSKRVTCEDIKKEMDKLTAMDALDESDAAHLATVKSEYRSKCMKSATGRSRGRAKVITKVEKAPTVASVSEEIKTDDVSAKKSEEKQDTKKTTGTTCDKPNENGCCPGETYTDMGDLGFNCCQDDGVTCFPPMKSEGSAPLCENDADPDEHGCCPNENYTDMGDLGFNCCQDDGVTCFPPIKK